MVVGIKLCFQMFGNNWRATLLPMWASYVVCFIQTLCELVLVAKGLSHYAKCGIDWLVGHAEGHLVFVKIEQVACFVFAVAKRHCCFCHLCKCCYLLYTGSCGIPLSWDSNMISSAQSDIFVSFHHCLTYVVVNVFLFLLSLLLSFFYLSYLCFLLSVSVLSLCMPLPIQCLLNFWMALLGTADTAILQWAFSLKEQ